MLHFVHKRLIHPLQLFIRDSRAIGITLLVCTALSLIVTNLSSWGASYLAFWNSTFDGTPAHHSDLLIFSFPNSPLLVINDGLMAVFFFLAGMEIKREMLHGQLATLKRAILPLGGAVGGMLVPALLFGLFNKGGLYMQGWAIPTATDIAFTLGIASLLGKRVPISLKIFLTALAIIDDLGAILVIALFYGGQVQLGYLLLILLISGMLWVLNRKKIPFGWAYWILGLALWYSMYHSGIHATVSGVLFASLVPVAHIKSLELRFHQPVYFLIMPLFALANTAILLPANSMQLLNSTLSWGILIGLCIGKPLGICTACYVLVKQKIAVLPASTSWYQLIGGGILAGVGFTMSIFIAVLAFTDQEQQNMAKISVLVASLSAMLIGYCWLRFRLLLSPASGKL